MKQTKQPTIKDVLSILQSSVAMAIDAGLPVEVRTAVLDGVPSVGIVISWCDFTNDGDFVLVGDGVTVTPQGAKVTPPDKESHTKA